ncbi:EIF2B1 [Cervus elaphus hippelaphus]|uniref:Translation initiation factor eIF2B subunit alpha n=1 Tax=Cervus elaphus hippelaphus TaxID=46360 RepID=A0A212D9H9_CEREH|nr:EIF2B1 [Cervus elaphus hippelaphus]
MASAVAAIRTLLEYLRRDTGETIQGLRANLTSAIETLCGVDSSVAVSSGGELFLRFISLTSLEYSRILTHAYSRVVLRVLEAAVAAKKRFSVYITESQPDLSGQVSFHVVTKKMAKALCHLNVPVTVVLDAAVGYIMEKVDLVIVGAEGVVENGGIINKVGASVLHRSLLRARSSTDDFGHPTTLYVMVHSSNPAYPQDSTIATSGFPVPLSHCSGIGTNQMAVWAKAQNKPFYVVAESFKFVRLFPLNQQDVPDKFKARRALSGRSTSVAQAKASPAQSPQSVGQTNVGFLSPQYKADTLKSVQTGQDLREEHPWVDYTSPSLITLLFTDLGVLTPSAVSDELIKLYL